MHCVFGWSYNLGKAFLVHAQPMAKKTIYLETSDAFDNEILNGKQLKIAGRLGLGVHNL